MINRHRPHLLVLPEDRANGDLANGFFTTVGISTRSHQILEPSGGWAKALAIVEEIHFGKLRKYPKSHLLVLIDCDSDANRLELARGNIPSDLANRIFILGVLSEPEELKNGGEYTLEKFGSLLAIDCIENTPETWNHSLLQHNHIEVLRLKGKIESFLIESID